jgi:hypothetical protein
MKKKKEVWLVHTVRIPGTGTLPHMGVPMLQRPKYGLNSNYYLYEHTIDFNSSTNLLNDHGMDLSTHCA